MQSIDEHKNDLFLSAFVVNMGILCVRIYGDE